jgi:uncharacterized protein
MKYKLSKYISIVDTNTNTENSIVFSTRTCGFNKISKQLLNSLFESELNIDTIDDETKNALISENIIVPANQNEYLDVFNENLEHINEKIQKELIFEFFITSKCQFTCDYCPQIKSKDVFNDKLIQNFEDRIAYKVKYHHSNEFNIRWLGGEPLLVIDQMEKTSNRFKLLAQKLDVMYSSNIFTNGYALTVDTFKRLLYKCNTNLFVITIDGSETYHNKRRNITKGDSFSKIINNVTAIVNSTDFIEQNCRLTIRCNIDERNFDGIDPLFDILQKNNLKQNITVVLTSTRPFTEKQHGILSLEEYSKKEILWIKKLDEKGIQRMPILPNRRRYSYCNSVLDRFECIDVNGDIYQCSNEPFVPRYTHLKLGNLSNLNDISVQRQSRTYYSENGFEECKSCSVFPICGGGCLKLRQMGINPCSSLKYNLNDRLKITLLRNYKGSETINDTCN